MEKKKDEEHMDEVKAVEEEDFDFAKMLEQIVTQFSEGNVVTGRVIRVEKDTIFVDIGYKSEGIVPASEFRLPDGTMRVEEGDEIDVYLEQLETRDGLVRLSWDKAEKMKRWDEIEKTSENGGTMKGLIVSTVKGGFTVDLGGIKAFLPASQADVKPIRDLRSLVGKEFDFKILKHNKVRSNIVVSRRAVLEEEREKKKKELLATLKEGDIVEGIVKNVVDFGIFVDLGGLDGMVHVGDVSWGRIPDINGAYKIGDKVKVKILSLDREKERAQLSIKHLTEDPWLKIEEKFPVAEDFEGKVISVTDNGVRVELAYGIEGFVPKEEVSWSRDVRNPSQVVQIGQSVKVKVLDYRKSRRELFLSIRQAKPNPWDTLTEVYSVGDKVHGKITGFLENGNGMFVEVLEGVEGLVRIGDVSWTERVANLKDRYRRGQEVEVKILSIDKENRKLSLGIKQLSEDPVANFIDEHNRGDVVGGRVTRVTNFGVFVELMPGVEALLRRGEADLDAGEKLEDKFKPEDEIRAMIVSLSKDERKIGLSVKKLTEKEEEEELKKFSGGEETKIVLGDVLKKSISVEEDSEEEQEKSEEE